MKEVQSLNTVLRKINKHLEPHNLVTTTKPAQVVLMTRTKKDGGDLAFEDHPEEAQQVPETAQSNHDDEASGNSKDPEFERQSVENQRAPETTHLDLNNKASEDNLDDQQAKKDIKIPKLEHQPEQNQQALRGYDLKEIASKFFKMK